MPKIEISSKTLRALCKKELKDENFEIVKGEVDSRTGDKIRLELGDTNRPDLWSVEGVARVFRERGIPKLNIRKSSKSIIVNKNMQQIRPYIAGFGALGINITHELLEDMIQIQEKISENFGRKRHKVSIGIYNYDKIKFPVHYRAISPKTSFAPLEFKEPMSMEEILVKHPKGIQYGYIVRHHNLFPIFIDSKNDVLSFPPIINSNYLGRVEPGMKNVFIEVTGTHMKSVLLATNILAYALADRKATIESINVEYGFPTEFGKKISTPLLFRQTMKIEKAMIDRIMGIRINTNQIKRLLESMQYNVSVRKNDIIVEIPPYRNDIMHPVDVIEDIAIAHGYQNLKPLKLTSYTTGSLKPLTEFSGICRSIMIGLGFQEILMPILTSMQKDSTAGKEKPVEIENVMSDSHSCVRTTTLTTVLHFLSRNLHAEYPQRVFEMGECCTTEPATKLILAGCISSPVASYQDISSITDSLLSAIGDYKLVKKNDARFIEGRCAHVIFNGVPIGTIGEIHPSVLNEFGIEKPVAAIEIDMNTLADLQKH